MDSGFGTKCGAPHFVPLSENEAEHEPKRLSRSGGLAHPGLVLEFKEIAPLRMPPRSRPVGLHSPCQKKRRESAARNFQSGSRIPRPPAPLVFFWRYSAQVASARFVSETDFCSLAILIASPNEASIWASSAPKAARNTARVARSEGLRPQCRSNIRSSR